MSRPAKAALLLGALVALVLQVLVVQFQVRSVAAMLATRRLNELDLLPFSLAWVVLVVPAIATFAAFVVLLVRFPGMSTNQRMSWIAACVVIGPPAWLAFWFARILRQPPKSRS